MSEERREKKTVFDLYREILTECPELPDEIENALLLASEHNMSIGISLRTCSLSRDDMEIKVFGHQGNYFDCSIYPVSGSLKLPPKEKSKANQNNSKSELEGGGEGIQEEFVNPRELETSRPVKVYERKTITDGAHKFIVTDLLDTFNRERQDFARRRIANVKKLSKELEDPNFAPLLSELMIKMLRCVIKTIVTFSSTKESYQVIRDRVVQKLKSENGQDFDESKIDWTRLTADFFGQENRDGKDAKQYRLLPSWFTDCIVDPKTRITLDCNLNLYCNEGVYESIACGIIFFEMLRLFNLDRYVNRNASSVLGSIDIFVENSSYHQGKLTWERKREEYAAKKREAAEKARNEMNGSENTSSECYDTIMLSENSNGAMMDLD